MPDSEIQSKVTHGGKNSTLLTINENFVIFKKKRQKEKVTFKC